MNPLQGITFYDSINRLVIGFLASFWVFYFIDDLSQKFDSVYYAAVYLIACFVFGLFFSLLVDWFAEKKHIGFLSKIFYKNNLEKIKRIASKRQVIILEDDIPIPDYWRKYYAVQQAGLLGNIPALEMISAFMLNLCALSLVSAVLSLALLAFSGCKCQLMWVPILSAFMVSFCTMTRNFVETKIYDNILSAYKYLEENNK